MATASHKKVETLSVTKLTDKNYSTLYNQMVVVLNSQELWSMVDGTAPKPADLTDTAGKAWVKNWEALSIILTSLTDDLLGQIDPLGTAREA